MKLNENEITTYVKTINNILINTIFFILTILLSAYVLITYDFVSYKDGEVRFHTITEINEASDFREKENNEYSYLVSMSKDYYYEANKERCENPKIEDICRIEKDMEFESIEAKFSKERISLLNNIKTENQLIIEVIEREIENYTTLISLTEYQLKRYSQELEQAKEKAWEEGREERLEQKVDELLLELKELKELKEAK
ncbi:Chromosome partitioning protein ParA [Vibrio crassostreae]|nr:Chromosome partitioning protein ParA [Vibrio crassostreae]